VRETIRHADSFGLAFSDAVELSDRLRIDFEPVAAGIQIGVSTG
jgi:hypothetical protein